MGNCCSNKTYYTQMACEVCELLDGDKTVKSVTYCDTCKAYICQKDAGNLIRRGLAAIKKIMNKKLQKQQNN